MKKLMTVRKVAEAFGVHEATVRRWMKAGVIKPENIHRPEGTRRYYIDAASQWPELYGEGGADD